MKSTLSVLLIIVVTCWECIHSEKHGCANTDGTNLRQPGGNENGASKLTFEGFSIKAEDDLGAFVVRVHQQDGDAGQICYSHNGGQREVAGDCASPLDGIYIQFHPKGSKQLSKVCEFNGVGGPKCPAGQSYVKGGECREIKQGKQAGADCKSTQLGSEFNGKVSVTKSGKQCFRWASLTIKRDFLEPAKTSKYFPEKNLADAANYCRNPDKELQGPWCYTNNKADWEYCGIPFCPGADCKSSQRGPEYNGKISVTKSGKKCFNWAALTIKRDFLEPAKTSELFPEKKLADVVNYCRNPDKEPEGPWCYTNNKADWEYCGIKFCPGFGCKSTQRGTEYKGQASVTYTGKKCFNWAALTIKRDFLEPAKTSKHFPEKNLADVVNYCRNPDKEPQGPWCYTNNKADWEYCGVPFCPGADCKLNKLGTEYNGQVSVTKSGKKCFNWAALTIKRNFLEAGKTSKHFPEKKLADAVNYCRNPDKEAQGPWCYIDNKATWESCSIPLCPGASKK